MEFDVNRSPILPRFRRRSAVALTSAFAALALLPVGAATASAHERDDSSRGAVFVQLNGTGGNEIAAYSRADDGTLTYAATYPTGGRGGTQVGAPLDALASQGSLVLDGPNHLLLAVNAGSDTITS